MQKHNLLKRATEAYLPSAGDLCKAMSIEGARVLGFTLEAPIPREAQELRWRRRPPSERTPCVAPPLLLAAPLIVNDERLGVIEVVNLIHTEVFGDDDLVLLELLAHSIALAIRHATRLDELQATEQNLRTQIGALRLDLARREPLDEIAGTSPEMTEVLKLVASVASVASSPISVLLEGETGTGKELVARAAPPQRSRRPTLPGDQLRRPFGTSSRERTVWPSQRRLYRRDQRSAWAVQGGIRRCDLPRRDRRDADADAAQVVARAPGWRNYSGGKHAPGTRRRPCRIGQQSRPARGRRRGGLSRIPVLSPARLPDRGAAIAQTTGGISPCWPRAFSHPPPNDSTSRFAVSCPQRRPFWRTIRGPGMCANYRTKLNGRWHSHPPEKTLVRRDFRTNSGTATPLKPRELLSRFLRPTTMPASDRPGPNSRPASSNKCSPRINATCLVRPGFWESPASPCSASSRSTASAELRSIEPRV